MWAILSGEASNESLFAASRLWRFFLSCCRSSIQKEDRPRRAILSRVASNESRFAASRLQGFFIFCFCSLGEKEDCPRRAILSGVASTESRFAASRLQGFFIFCSRSSFAWLDQKMKKPMRLRRKGFRSVGVRGFEPPASSSRTTRANRAALHPVLGSHATRERVAGVANIKAVGSRRRTCSRCP